MNTFSCDQFLLENSSLISILGLKCNIYLCLYLYQYPKFKLRRMSKNSECRKKMIFFRFTIFTLHRTYMYLYLQSFLWILSLSVIKEMPFRLYPEQCVPINNATNKLRLFCPKLFVKNSNFKTVKSIFQVRSRFNTNDRTPVPDPKTTGSPYKFRNHNRNRNLNYKMIPFGQ